MRSRFNVELTGTDLSAGRQFTKLGTQIRDVDRDMAKAARRANGFSAELKGVAAGLLAAFSFSAIKGQVDDALQAADAIDKLSKATDISAESLQRFLFAGEQMGVQNQFLADGFARFNKRLHELNTLGTAPGADGFKALGIAQDFASGKLATTEDALQAAIERLAELKTSGERAALAARLFGDDAGPGMAKLLAEGVEGIEYWKERAGVLTDEQVASAVRLNDAWNEMTNNMTAKWRGFVLDTVGGWRDIFAVISGDLPGMSDDRLNQELLEARLESGKKFGQHLRASRDDMASPVAVAALKAEADAAAAAVANIEAEVAIREKLARLKLGDPGASPTLSSTGGRGGKSLAEQEAEAAEKAGEKLDDLVRAHMEWVDQKRFELDTIGVEKARLAELNDERDIAARMLERELLAIDALRDGNDEYMATLDQYGQAEREMARAIREKTAAHEAEEAALERSKAATEQATAALANMFSTIRSGEDLFFGLLSMGVQGLFGQGALGGVVNEGLGVESGGIIGTLFNAKGNAFDSGGVVPFAKGGVVDRMTPFRFGGGKLGVMGEAGTEAVMPLTRTSDGRLGVAASGGGAPVVNVYVETHLSKPVQVEQRQDDGDLRLILREEVGKIVGQEISRTGSPADRSLRARGV